MRGIEIQGWKKNYVYTLQNVCSRIFVRHGWRRCPVRWLTRGVGVETILHNHKTRHNRVLKWDIGGTFIGDDFSDALFPLCNVEKGK